MMPNSKRNWNSNKGTDEESRTGKPKNWYQKLRDDPLNNPAKSVSTDNNTADGKYSRTRKRDEEIDNDETRRGR